MKKQIVKSAICIFMSAAMIFGEASIAIAAAPGEAVDSVTASADSLAGGTEAVEGTETTEVTVPETETTEVTVPETEGSGAVKPSAETAESSTEKIETVIPETEVTETALPSAEEAAEEEVDAVGKQIVNFATLETVAGIGYDEKNEIIYWNKVPNASAYQVVITDLATGGIIKDEMCTDLSKSFDKTGGYYSVSVKAYDKNEYYLAGTHVSEADYKNDYKNRENFGAAYKDRVNGTYTIYNHPMSVAAGIINFQIVIPDYAKTKTLIGPITTKDSEGQDCIFEVVNPPTLLEGESYAWDISNHYTFESDVSNGYFKNTVYSDESSLSVSQSDFVPGEICYVRARVYSSKYEPDTGLSDRDAEAQKYGTFTNTISYLIKEAVIDSVDTIVTGKSVSLEVYLESGSVKGYQFSKKTGKKWITLAKQTDSVYKDSGLSENKSYKYRVRGYSYNKRTGKTKYTGWKYVDATTWGASLKLKASAEGSTAVKLSWNKISNAKGYEIYRTDTSSRGRDYTEGRFDDSFENYKLIKTIKSSKTTNYTDKKLTSGNTYSYLIRAYCTNKDNKNYIQEKVNISLNTRGFQVQNQYYTSSGSYKVVWQKMTGIAGFKVEKYDSSTRRYDLIKELSKSSTSYTFPKVAVGSADVKYIIRPYIAFKTYPGSKFTVSAKLGTVKNVKASATTEGIKVTWSEVAGADYYKVYRTTNTSYVYDKTTKTYSYRNGQLVFDSAVDRTGFYPELGDRLSTQNPGTYRNSEIRTTSVIDRNLTYLKTATDENGSNIPVRDAAGNELKDTAGNALYQTKEAVFNKGPEKGVTYSYYVVAVAEAKNGQSTSAMCASASSSKAAKAMLTDKKVKKVSKISSVKSKKKGEATISYGKASGASGYAVYRATSKKGTYVLVGTTTKTSYTDTGLSSGKTYYYKVASYTLSEARAYIYSSMTSYKSVKTK